MTTAVLICAAGEGTRWYEQTKPKQLAWLGDETIIQRQIRQVKQRNAEPLVVTRDQQIQYATWDNEGLTHSPASHRWLAETILDTEYRWNYRTIILLGDVVYSGTLMDTIFADTERLSVYGNNAEAMALVFRESGRIEVLNGLHKVLQSAERGETPGKLWNLYRWLDGISLTEHRIRDDGIFRRVHDWSTDIDTPEDYRRFQHDILEMQIIDDRLVQA